VLRIAVITISDRAARGDYTDMSGPAIIDLLDKSRLDCTTCHELVPDDKDKIYQALSENLDNDYILTTGGTGISQRDVTPDVTASVCDRECTGISNYLRNESLKETPFAVFSRLFCGIKGKTIIINFPGSVKAAQFCTRLVIPLLEHGYKMLQGKGH